MLFRTQMVWGVDPRCTTCYKLTPIQVSVCCYCGKNQPERFGLLILCLIAFRPARTPPLSLDGPHSREEPAPQRSIVHAADGAAKCAQRYLAHC